MDSRRCMSGIVVTLGSSVIYAKYYTQPTTATSRCEAELCAQFEAAHCIQHFRWAAQFLELEQQGPTGPLQRQPVSHEAAASTGAGVQVKASGLRYLKIKELVSLHEGADTKVADTLTEPLGTEVPATRSSDATENERVAMRRIKTRARRMTMWTTRSFEEVCSDREVPRPNPS